MNGIKVLYNFYMNIKDLVLKTTNASFCSKDFSKSRIIIYKSPILAKALFLSLRDREAFFVGPKDPLPHLIVL